MRTTNTRRTPSAMDIVRQSWNLTKSLTGVATTVLSTGVEVLQYTADNTSKEGLLKLGGLALTASDIVIGNEINTAKNNLHEIWNNTDQTAESLLTFIHGDKELRKAYREVEDALAKAESEYDLALVKEEIAELKEEAKQILKKEK